MPVRYRGWKTVDEKTKNKTVEPKTDSIRRLALPPPYPINRRCGEIDRGRKKKNTLSFVGKKRNVDKSLLI